MKFLLSLSFLLFAAASSINASSFFADAHTPPPILDSHRNPLQFGVPYYMVPVLQRVLDSSGVRLGSASQFDPCAKQIELTDRVNDRGTPVVFSSAVQNVTGNITTGTELIISFYNLTRPNDESCGGSNSTTWVTAIKWDLEVGGKAMSNVFRLSLGWMDNPFFHLRPVVQSVMEGYVDWRNVEVHGRVVKFLVVTENPREREWNELLFAFRKAKRTEEDEGDKPVIIQMPRKMSV